MALQDARARCLGIVVALALVVGPPRAAGPSARPGAQSPEGLAGAASFDLVVLDKNGRAPDSLRPEDFRVTVDGAPRRVAWVRRVSRGPGAAQDAGTRSVPALTSLTFGVEASRNFFVVVDQATLVRGDERPVIRTAGAFLDRLGITDRVAVVRLPVVSGQPVTLTTERPAARDELSRVLGQDRRASVMDSGDPGAPGQQDRAVAPEPDRDRAADPDRPGQVPQPDPTATTVQPPETSGPAGSAGTFSLLAVLNGIRALPGRKVIVFISGGLAGATPAMESQLAMAAVGARASVHVIGVPRISAAALSVPDFAPLALLARATGGSFALLARNPDRMVERLVAELSTCYVIGLDPQPPDTRTGALGLRVEMARPGLTVRAPAWFIPTPDPGDMAPAAPGEVVAAAAPGPAAAQAPRAARPSARDAEAQLALAKATDYVRGYEQQYSALVAEEDYRQQLARRSVHLRSDFLLIKPQGSDEWVSFRDVFEVDGRPVRDRDDRLKQLFLDQSPEARASLRAIKDEGARYNIGPWERNINVPLLPLSFLEPGNLPRFRFSLSGRRESEGVPVWRLRFEEVARPTLIRSHEGSSVPANGWFLVDRASGAVVETYLNLEQAQSLVEMTVRYRRDPALGMWVPGTMKETYRVFAGRGYQQYPTLEAEATYSNFRRFQVTTEERVTIPR